MPASTFREVYKFEQYLENAARMVVSSSFSSYYANELTRDTRGTELEFTPSLGVYCQMGGATGHKTFILNSSGNIASQAHDIFEGSMNVTIATERSQNNSYHDDLVAEARWRISDIDNFNVDTWMPYHDLLAITFQGSTDEVDDKTNQDLTTLTYSFTIGIKPVAWPRL